MNSSLSPLIRRSFRGFRCMHEAAATGFSKENVERYESGRPSYSLDTLQKVRKILQTQKTTEKQYSICEIGAGTGKFTKAFVEFSKSNSIGFKEYMAIEPTDFIHRLRELRLGIDVRKTVGDNIPAENGQFDAVIIAQAFHWMDNIKTLSEIHRILKPGGPLIMIWNGYDSSVDWIRQFEEEIIIPRYPPGCPRFQSMEWEKIFDSTDGKMLFGPITKQYSKLNAASDTNMIINRATSTSIISNQSDEVKRAVAQQVRDLIASHPSIQHLNTIDFSYRTLIAYSLKR